MVTKTGGSNPAVDSLFGYDELNRLTNFKTGQLNVAGTAIGSPVSTQTFELDETGNFTGFTEVLGSTTLLDQTRSHNDVNEITAISETVGNAWATPVHDTAGNMTSLPCPSNLTASCTLTWDAWQRLSTCLLPGGLSVDFEYDGSNRRIVVSEPASGSSSSSSWGSETRHVYYSGQQAIEERIGSSSNADQQFVWSLGYIDDLVLRDRDTNGNGTLNERLYALSDLRFSVVALANTSGSIVERFKYDAHGRVSVLSSNFVVRSSSNYDWQFRYTGRREDLATGLYYFRARYYSAELGRFISRDPIGFADGMNLYRAYFVPRGVDPFGLKVGLEVVINLMDYDFFNADDNVIEFRWSLDVRCEDGIPVIGGGDQSVKNVAGDFEILEASPVVVNSNLDCGEGQKPGVKLIWSGLAIEEDCGATTTGTVGGGAIGGVCGGIGGSPGGPGGAAGGAATGAGVGGTIGGLGGAGLDALFDVEVHWAFDVTIEVCCVCLGTIGGETQYKVWTKNFDLTSRTKRSNENDYYRTGTIFENGESIYSIAEQYDWDK